MFSKKFLSIFSGKSRRLIILLFVLTVLNGLFMFLEVLASQILIESASQGLLVARVIVLVLVIYVASYFFFYRLSVVTAKTRSSVRLDLDVNHFRSILSTPRHKMGNVAGEELSGAIYTGRNERLVGLGVITFSDFVLDTVFLISGMAYLVVVNWIAAAICVTAYVIVTFGAKGVAHLNRRKIEVEPKLFGEYCDFVDNAEKTKFQALSLGQLENLETRAAQYRKKFIECRYRISRNSEIFDVVQTIMGNIRDFILLAVLITVGQDHATLFVVIYLAGMINDSVSGWASRGQELMSVSSLAQTVATEVVDKVPETPDPKLIALARKDVEISVDSCAGDRTPAGQIALQSNNWYQLEGTNGSGKSSLLRGILGLEELPVKTKTAIGKQQFQQVPRGLSLTISEQDELIYGTVKDNVTMLNPTEDQTRLERVLQAVGLKCDPQHSAQELSGGQKQRVLLARALYMNPPILVLDEAFSQVDEQTAAQIAQTIHQDREGITIAVEHRKKALQIDNSQLLQIRGGVLHHQH